MADKVKFQVLREMEGDRFYRAGETREMAEADAVHLVRLGVLKKVDGKAEAVTANKSEHATENKGGQKSKAKADGEQLA